MQPWLGLANFMSLARAGKIDFLEADSTSLAEKSLMYQSVTHHSVHYAQ